MAVRIESYTPPPEFVQIFLEFMNKLSNDVRTKTEAPEGACATVAIMVAKGFLEALESELKIVVPSSKETKH